MNRKLASIQRIINIEPIENAEAIERVSVLGWHCVAKKGEFQIGDLCIYFEIDSLLPMIEVFDFMAPRGTKKMVHNNQDVEGYLLKTVRLRGQISQGLCLPIDILRAFHKSHDSFGMPLVMPTEWQEGDDVTDYVGVIKYEPPIPAELRGNIKGAFPGFLKKTDETRIQVVPQILGRYKNEHLFYAAEKLDGASMTIYKTDEDFGVCGRNWEMQESENHTMWKIANKYELREKMPYNIALQGELVGEGIQGNPLKIKGQKFYVYNVYNIHGGVYFDYFDAKMLIASLGLEMVPIYTDYMKLPSTVDELVEYATIKSTINPDVWAEGVVIRPRHEMRDEDLGRLSFKVINPEYLL